MEIFNINGMEFSKSHVTVLEVRMPNENTKEGEPCGCFFRFEVSPEVKNPNVTFGKAIEDFIEEHKREYGEHAEVTVDDICGIEEEYFEKYGLYRCTSEIPAQGIDEEAREKTDRIFNLVIEDNSSLKPRVWVMSFQMERLVSDPEAAARAAVKEFITSGTVDAKEALDYAAGSLNWGDVMARMPENYFVKYGLTPISRKETVAVCVDHDEVLE